MMIMNNTSIEVSQTRPHVQPKAWTSRCGTSYEHGPQTAKWHGRAMLLHKESMQHSGRTKMFCSMTRRRRIRRTEPEKCDRHE